MSDLSHVITSATVSLLFRPNFYNEVVRLWNKPFSASVHAPLANRYANMKGLAEHGYMRMQRVENLLVSYLVPSAGYPDPISRLMWWWARNVELCTPYRFCKLTKLTYSRISTWVKEYLRTHMHHIPSHSRGSTSPSSDPVADPSWRQGQVTGGSRRQPHKKPKED